MRADRQKDAKNLINAFRNFAYASKTAGRIWKCASLPSSKTIGLSEKVKVKVKVKINQSHYRPGVAQRVPES